MKNDRQQVDDRFLDELLDATLERARDAEPRPGLEGRVMARVRAERAARSQFGWKWRLVAGLAVLVVVALAAKFMLRSGSTPRPHPVPALVSQTRAPEATSPSTATTSKPAAQSQPAGRSNRKSSSHREPRVWRRRGSVHLASAEPKQFPSPSPLSEEENLLLHAKDAPPSVLVAWGGSDVAGDLQIKDLDISPLENWPPDSDSEQK
jgi:hypothetical protein